MYTRCFIISNFIYTDMLTFSIIDKSRLSLILTVTGIIVPTGGTKTDS